MGYELLMPNWGACQVQPWVFLWCFFFTAMQPDLCFLVYKETAPQIWEQCCINPPCGSTSIFHDNCSFLLCRLFHDSCRFLCRLFHESCRFLCGVPSGIWIGGWKMMMAHTCQPLCKHCCLHFQPICSAVGRAWVQASLHPPNCEIYHFEFRKNTVDTWDSMLTTCWVMLSLPQTANKSLCWWSFLQSFSCCQCSIMQVLLEILKHTKSTVKQLCKQEPASMNASTMNKNLLLSSCVLTMVAPLIWVSVSVLHQWKKKAGLSMASSKGNS